MWQDYFQILLKQKYKNAKARNPSYSMRAFSEKLGIGRGDISELISGKRKISKKRALKISEKLELTSNETICLQELTKENSFLPRKTLNTDHDFILKSGLYIPLLCLLELDKPPTKPAEMALMLNQSEQSIEEALQILEQRNLIKKIDGLYRMVELSLKTTEDIPNTVYRSVLMQDFETAKRAIENLDPSLRECTSMTFSGSSQLFSEMKNEIRAFRDKLTLVASKDSKDQVYNLTIGLIPLTSSIQE